jgi:hypothetical protein
LPPLDHLVVLSDDTGVMQHACESVPNRRFGYCTDDVARAFMVALARLELVPRDETAARLASTYLSFLQEAQLDDGRFHNFMAYDRSWLDDVGTQDSCGRAIWSLGYGMAHAPSESWRHVCRAAFERALPGLGYLEFTRSRAYAMLGLAHAYGAFADPIYASALRAFAGALVTAYDAVRSDEWLWFEDFMTYDNARLPEALFRAGEALGDERHVAVAATALAFYENVTIENGMFVPIGNDGWYVRGGVRARYSQQPLEAAAMVDAELAASDVTGNRIHRTHAESALAWYYGKNSRGITMAQGGGCFDGLEEQSINRNMGAESTLALLAGAYAMAQRQARTLRAVR